jgi:hypothetical protein
MASRARLPQVKSYLHPDISLDLSLAFVLVARYSVVVCIGRWVCALAVGRHQEWRAHDLDVADAVELCPDPQEADIVDYRSSAELDHPRWFHSTAIAVLGLAVK